MIDIEVLTAYVGHNNKLFDKPEDARNDLAYRVLDVHNHPYEVYLKLKEIYGENLKGLYGEA